MSNVDLPWSDECQAKWLLAHEYAADNNIIGVLCTLAMLLVALQHAGASRDTLVARLSSRLLKADSPIHLLARKSATGNYRLPVLKKDGTTIAYEKVAHELHVHLESFGAYQALIREEWGTEETHMAALAQSGFSYE
jgi:hypothetical protein